MNNVVVLLVAAIVLTAIGVSSVLAAETPQDSTSEKGGKIYKRVGPNGEVIYSDKPAPDSKEMTVPSGSGYKPVRPPASFTPYQPPPKTQPKKAIENKVTITSPKNDQAFWSGSGEVTVTVSLAKSLASGEQLEYLLDGKQVYSGTEASHALTNVFRGTHTLTVRLVGTDGSSIMSEAVTFHVHRPTIKK